MFFICKHSLTFIFYVPGHDICLAMVQSLSPFKRWVVNKTNIFVSLLFNANSFLLKVINFFVLPKGAFSRDAKNQKLSNLKIRTQSLPHHSCRLKSITNVQIFILASDISWCSIWYIIQMKNPLLNPFSHICFGFAKLVRKDMHSDPGVFMGWLVPWSIVRILIHIHWKLITRPIPRGIRKGVVVRVNVM